MKSPKEILHPKSKKQAGLKPKLSRLQRARRAIREINRALATAALAEILRPELERLVEAEMQIYAESQVKADPHVTPIETLVQPAQQAKAVVAEPASSETKHRKSKKQAKAAPKVSRVIGSSQATRKAKPAPTKSTRSKLNHRKPKKQIKASSRVSRSKSK